MVSEGVSLGEKTSCGVRKSAVSHSRPQAPPVFLKTSMISVRTLFSHINIVMDCLWLYSFSFAVDINFKRHLGRCTSGEEMR